MTLSCVVVFHLQGHCSVMLILFLSIQSDLPNRLFTIRPSFALSISALGTVSLKVEAQHCVGRLIIQEPGGYCWDIASHKVIKVNRA